MTKYLLITLFISYPLLSMEQPSQEYSVEITDEEIQSWFNSLDVPSTISSPPLLNPENFIDMPTIEPAQDQSFENVLDYFKSQTSDPDNPVITRVQPRVLTPIEKIIRAIRCTDYRELSETILADPLVVNEKKSLHICDLLKPPNCRKSERILQMVTPLIFSCHQKANYIVKKLLVNNADPNQSGHKGITPLLVAASNGNYEAAEDLLRAGADPNKADEDNNTALKLAAKRNNKNIEFLILKHIRNVQTSHYLAQGEWMSLLFHAITDLGNSYQVLLLTAPDKKRDINALNLVEVPSVYSDNVSLRMLTALHFAAYYRNEKAIKILLSAGADPNVMEHHRVTPLHVAAFFGDSKISQALLQNGAKKNLRENFWNLTAAEIAARRKHFETQKIIMYHAP